MDVIDMSTTRDFAKVIRGTLAQDHDLAAAVSREALSANIAVQVYQARKDAKLSQAELAKRIGSHQSVISRIEDADYDGHSLALLVRIAEALNLTLGVEFYKRQQLAEPEHPKQVPVRKAKKLLK